MWPQLTTTPTHTVLKIKVLFFFWHLWFHEESLTSMAHFHYKRFFKANSHCTDKRRRQQTLCWVLSDQCVNSVGVCRHCSALDWTDWTSNQWLLDLWMSEMWLTLIWWHWSMQECKSLRLALKSFICFWKKSLLHLFDQNTHPSILMEILCNIVTI